MVLVLEAAAHSPAGTHDISVWLHVFICFMRYVNCGSDFAGLEEYGHQADLIFER
jgi:hypothetical protein